VLLFNLCGYRLVIDYLQQRHTEELTAQLDKDEYADADLISIKTALSLPYYTATMDFERIDGSIRIDGVEYTYVKRRIINDSLELLCLPNPVKQKLQTAKADFFKLSNDLQRPESNKKAAAVIKTVLPEYCETPSPYHLQALPATKQNHRLAAVQFTSFLYMLAQDRPPETRRLSS
jgi:hypothetical protein